MKRFILVGLIILVLVGLTACETTTVTVTSTQEQQAQINELTSELNDLQSQMDALQGKYDTDLGASQGQIDDLNAQLAVLQTEYDALQELYDNLVSGGSSGLRNPSWTELKAFITQDKTDEIPYNLKTFACAGFATLVRDNAHALGFRVAFIQISFSAGAGHAFNLFQTSDYGATYIDCTGVEAGKKSDKVGYVKVGQLYGTIDLNCVKAEYISCDGDPEDFWQVLTYETSDNPFAYEYYTEYVSRQAFLSATIQDYNSAVGEYNSHSGGWTPAQLTAWNNNINALKAELGTSWISLGYVNNVETYWGNN
ncbi:MAG: hypothetical protein JW967_00925 [Dehalococcoidales bacterium]|nr:hypothetical protein [Dehalococcoidales bacterium]